MNEKDVQVAIGSKRPRQSRTVTQTPVEVLKKDQGTQCGMAKGSYGREGEHRKWRYDDLIVRLYANFSVCETMSVISLGRETVYYVAYCVKFCICEVWLTKFG